jgi:hypothetical protein
MAARDLETELVVGARVLMAAFAAARRVVEEVLLEKDTCFRYNVELASNSIPAPASPRSRPNCGRA